jgi:serine/threonine protein kinase
MTKLSTNSSPDEINFSPFCAPEIKAKIGHTSSLDIWCLGMLFYYILSDGSYPYGIPSNVATQNITPEEINSIESRMR